MQEGIKNYSTLKHASQQNNKSLVVRSDMKARYNRTITPTLRAPDRILANNVQRS